MNYYSIPADFKKETIDKIKELHEHYPTSRVIETYGNIVKGAEFYSGRVIDQLPKTDIIALEKYLNYSLKNGIDFNYTLNGSFYNNSEFTEEGVSKFYRFFKMLKSIGINSVTVAMPSLIELIKNSGIDFKIKASTICHITNTNKALAYKKMGVNRIVVDESLHRDFISLKSIRKAFGENVELIANTMCHKNCIYRQFHYNETSADSIGESNKVSINYFEHKCILQRYRSKNEILQLAWIRPEDIKFYNEIGIHYFKLQGRQHVHKGGHLLTLEYYFKEKYDGNLMDLLDMFNKRYSFNYELDNTELENFILPFYKGEIICNNDCTACNYCNTYQSNSLNSEKNKQTITQAREFYKEYDQFKELIKKSEDKEEIVNKINIDFNLE